MSRDILLVEADPMTARLMLQVFQDTIPDVQVQLATSTSEALDFLFRTGPFTQRESSLSPALIWLDLTQPQTSGLALVEVIKSYARTRTIPIVMIAEPTNTHAVFMGYRLGVNACVMKSTDTYQFIQDLARTVQYWLKVNRGTNPDGYPAVGTDAPTQV